jgi:DNA gyrase inhibitor GyrI
MSELEVRIVKLEPMRVASVYGFGESPERQAWEKLVAWAGPKGLLDDAEKHRIFGFNNPNPSPGSPNYGYEFWIVVGPDVEPEGDVRIVDFAGGLYAVTRCEELSKIGQLWQRLAAWQENSEYRSGSHQWLEENVGPVDVSHDEDALVLDLYLPIVS